MDDQHVAVLAPAIIALAVLTVAVWIFISPDRSMHAQLMFGHLQHLISG